MDSQDHKITTSSGHENLALHLCHKCGWPFPNPHPSSRHRRAHKKVCGKVEGYKLSEFEAADDSIHSALSDDDEQTPSPKGEKTSVKSYRSEDETFADAVTEFSDIGISPSTDEHVNISDTNVRKIDDELLKADTTEGSSVSINDVEVNDLHSEAAKSDTVLVEPTLAAVDELATHSVPVEGMLEHQEREAPVPPNLKGLNFSEVNDEALDEEQKQVDLLELKADDSTENVRFERYLSALDDPELLLKDFKDQDTFKSSIPLDLGSPLDLKLDENGDKQEQEQLDKVESKADSSEEIKDSSEIEFSDLSRDDEGKEGVHVVCLEKDLTAIDDNPEHVLQDFKDHDKLKSSLPLDLGSSEEISKASQSSVALYVSEGKAVNTIDGELSSIPNPNGLKEPEDSTDDTSCLSEANQDVVTLSVTEKETSEDKRAVVSESDKTVSESEGDYIRSVSKNSTIGKDAKVAESVGTIESNSKIIGDDSDVKEPTSLLIDGVSSASKNEGNEKLRDENLHEVTEDSTISEDAKVSESAGTIQSNSKIISDVKESTGLLIGGVSSASKNEGDEKLRDENLYEVTEDSTISEDAKVSECAGTIESNSKIISDVKEPTGLLIDVVSSALKNEGSEKLRDEDLHEVFEDSTISKDAKVSESAGTVELNLKVIGDDSDVKKPTGVLIDGISSALKTEGNENLRDEDLREVSEDSTFSKDAKVSESAGTIESNLKAIGDDSDVKNPTGLIIDGVSSASKTEVVEKLRDEDLHEVSEDSTFSKDAKVSESAGTIESNLKVIGDDSDEKKPTGLLIDGVSSASKNDGNEKLIKQNDTVSPVDISVTSSSNSLDANWGSVSVLSTQSESTVVPEKSERDLQKKSTSGAESDAFEPPSFMTLVESSESADKKAAAVSEIEKTEAAQKAGWFPSITNVVHESQGRKKNEEIIAKVTNWGKQQHHQHTPLKNLLSEVKSPKAKQVPPPETAAATKTTVNSILSSEPGRTTKEAAEKEWSSPARYPVEIKKQKRKTKPYWVPFVCCSSVHQDA